MMRKQEESSRVPIQPENKWDTVYNKYIRYIRYAANNTFSDNCTMSHEDLFQEGQIVLYRCYLQYSDRTDSEFGKLFKSSLWRELRKLANRTTVATVDIESVMNIDLTGYTEDIDESIYDSCYIDQVRQLIAGSDIAIEIFNELINPSEDTLFEAEMDVARRETLRSQGKKVLVPHSVRVTHRHIRMALGLTRDQFTSGMRIIREAVESTGNGNLAMALA